MNFAALNATPLNVGVNDATIRGLVVGASYAMSQPQPRLMLRASGSGLNEFGIAIATVIGKKLTRLALLAATGEAVSSPRVRALARSPTAEQAFANASPSMPTILLKLSAQASAQAVLVLRALQRSVAARQAAAVTTYLARMLARDTTGEIGQANATPVGRGLSRSLIDGQAAATAVRVRLIGLLRSVTAESASAIGYVGGRTTIKYAYDLPAITENTFIVPFENNIFYVR